MGDIGPGLLQNKVRKFSKKIRICWCRLRILRFWVSERTSKQNLVRSFKMLAVDASNRKKKGMLEFMQTRAASYFPGKGVPGPR